MQFFRGSVTVVLLLVGLQSGAAAQDQSPDELLETVRAGVRTGLSVLDDIQVRVTQRVVNKVDLPSAGGRIPKEFLAAGRSRF